MTWKFKNDITQMVAKQNEKKKKKRFKIFFKKKYKIKLTLIPTKKQIYGFNRKDLKINFKINFFSHSLIVDMRKKDEKGVEIKKKTEFFIFFSKKK